MLALGPYLLGVAQILALAGFAGLGATVVRRRFVAELTGAPAFLATLVIALALLIWVAEALGAFGLFEPLPYLVGIALLGGGACAALGLRPSPASEKAGDRELGAAAAVALLVALVALVHFADGVRLRLDTGMTGFDSTWYHGPFAAGFHQSGNTWDLHFIAPQFLAWFYPANSELFHAVGMNAFDRDLLSPLLNLGWLIGCLLACWCIGRPYRVAPWSLALGAIALSVPALSDQAGEARNDIVGIFFLLAAVAIAVNAWTVRGGEERGLSTGALLLAGLAAGLAAGTKLNFLLPCAVLVLGLACVSPAGGRGRALGLGTVAALAGGGYWYLRNLAHTGNPLPWFDSVGLPGPDQALGGREEHSVLGYLTDGTVWSDWFLPGLRDGLWIIWPLLLLGAVAGLSLALGGFCRRGGAQGSTTRRDPALAAAGLTGLAAAAAWLIAPTSASGPEGMPHGFESGLRYLAPALVLGLALLPTARFLRDHLASLALRSYLLSRSETNYDLIRGIATVVVVLAVGAGYIVQRDYLRDRYAHPTFAAPGLNAAFEWATPLSGARIATTSTRQYPLFGTELSNTVEFVGEDRPHGGFVPPETCRNWRRLLDEGRYDYVVASRDRVEPGKPPYPESARWTEGPGAEVVFRKPPTVVFDLTGPLDPSSCPR
jgi:hypothetical protein